MVLSIGSCLAIGILVLTSTVNSLSIPPNPLSLQCPLAQPKQTGLQVTRSLDVWPHEDDVLCFRQGFFGGSLAHTQHCRIAMGSLPGAHLPGGFHSGGNVEDPYSLPKYLLHEKCNITIEIPAQALDETTWPCVGQRIDILINACKVGTDHDGHVGGQTWAGANKEMVVTIVKPGKEVPQGLYDVNGLVAPQSPPSTLSSFLNSSGIDGGAALSRRSGSRVVNVNGGTL